jgi:RNA polymerase sigma-70 factor (ECF subfamily)
MDVSDGDRPAADDSDEALMARIARGDERAYRVLARRHLPAMLGLARRILGNAADAEDVAQEAWGALEAAGELVDPAPGAVERSETEERDRRLAAAIAGLPARQRSAIVLTYGDGMSNAQVAEVLDTTVSAVETLLVRGKQNLRRALGDAMDEDKE